MRQVKFLLRKDNPAPGLARIKKSIFMASWSGRARDGEANRLAGLNAADGACASAIESPIEERRGDERQFALQKLLAHIRL